MPFTRTDRQALGRQGEDLAVRELERRGCVILERRYRSRFGEIDIVARDGRTVVFVEVKARRTRRCGGALDAIPPWKQRRIAAMALDYLAWTNRLHAPCRFDVVAVDGLGDGPVELQVVQNAFVVDG